MNKKREELLKPYKTSNGEFYYFEKLPLSVLKELVNLGFADVDEQQNNAPSIGEFIEVMGDTFTAHGYAVNHDRDDVRVSIEGLESDKGVTFADVEQFRQADEFTLEDNSFRCWWD